MNTNGIGNTYAAQAMAQVTAAPQAKDATKVTMNRGQKEIGEPKLSEKAQKYYDRLKKKFSNMDFILVSADMKEEAEANAGKYGSNKSLIVLIDDEKIEEMANDPATREKYEGVLRGATTQFAQMKQDLGSNADNVKAFGMKVNDNGTASYFAVVDKSLSAQKKRIEEKADKNREDKKKAERQERKEQLDGKYADNAKDEVTVTASSWDELLKKINDTIGEWYGNSVRTQQETWVGQQFDYTV